MAVSISMSIFQNSQSIENNTSNVTVEVYAHWTKGSYNAQTAQDGYPDARGTVTIDDVAYAFYSKFNTGHTISGSERIFVKTLDIDHNNEGEKVLSCWASYATGVSSGTVSTSGSLALATIPRKSIIKATDGVLGIEQILKVERKSSILTHTVAYQCNAESGILCEKSGTTEIAWIPPLSLAAHYPSATSVPIVFTVTTYHGDKEIGSSAVTVTYAVPESVKPAVSLEVSDLMGCFAKYGAYVQKKSRLRIAVAASANQGARITAYRIEADGKNYTNSTAITEPISGSGDLTVKATVTDTRGRTETASLTIPVMAYMSPNISAVTVERTDERGNTDPSGAYLTVLFNAEVTALGKKNSAVYTIQYKKTNEAHYSLHTASDYTGQHTVNNGVFTFAAETVSSYDILVTVSDDYESGSKIGKGSSIKKTWSMHKSGSSVAFGKIAEGANCLDMGWFIKMNGNKITDLGTPTDAHDAVNKSYVDNSFAPFNFISEYSWCDTYAECMSKLKSVYSAMANGDKKFVRMGIGTGGTSNGELSGGGWFFELNRYYADYGHIIATNELYVFRLSNYGGWGKWVDASPSAFAPAGYGLGIQIPNLVTDYVNDLNKLTINGRYNITAGLQNSPVTYGTVDVISRDENDVLQIVYSRDTGKAPTLQRNKVFGTWGEWKQCDPSAFAPAKVLLYENASPSSTFAQQLVSVQTNGYSHYLIEFNSGTDYAMFRSDCGSASISKVIANSSGTAMAMQERKIYIDSRGITFYSGSAKYVNSTETYVNDDVFIPYRIYGVKG